MPIPNNSGSRVEIPENFTPICLREQVASRITKQERWRNLPGAIGITPIGSLAPVVPQPWGEK